MSTPAFRKYILLTAFLSLLSCLYSQKYQNYYYKVFNKQNNQLSENNISGLLLDQNKLLWIATPNGLFSFNGSVIEPYPVSIPERISSIYQNGSKDLLIKCVNKKSYVVRNDSFNESHELPFNVTAGYSSSLLEKSKSYKFDIQKLNRDSLLKATALFVSSPNVSFVRINNRIYRVSNGHYTLISDNFPTDIKDIFIDDKYWVYYPKDGKMHCISDATANDVSIPLSSNEFENAKLYAQNAALPVLIFGKHAWTFLKNRLNGKFEWQLIANNIPEDVAFYSAIYSPELKKLFLGTLASGLIVVSKSAFAVYQHPLRKNEINFYRYYVQIPKKDGTVIADYPSLYSNTPAEFRKFFNKYDISYSYHYLDSSNIIGNTSDFFYTLNTETLIPKKVSKQPGNKLSNQSYVQFGKYTYIFNSSGIYKYDRSKDSIYLVLQTTIGYQLINQSIIINNKIFLSYCGGIMIYDPIRNKVEKNILKSTCFRYFYRYKSQVIVTTYGKGLHLLDTVNYTIKALKSDYFNALKRTHFLYQDKNNFIWASTNDGILRIPGFSFDRMLAGGDFQPQPQYFDSKNGLPTDEMNGGTYPAYINFGDTLLSFPSLVGIIQFHPLRDFPPRTAGLGIQIKKISSLGKLLQLNKNALTISSDNNEVKFQIQVAHWDNPKNLNLYYRLNNKIFYIPYTEINNLNILFENYGKYTLEFLYIDDFGKETIINKINIEKEKPWYLTWVYIVTALIVITGAGFIFYLIRTKRIEKKNIILQNIIDEKTQEIRKINESLVDKISELTKLNKINNIYISVINHDIFAPIKYINMVGDKVYDFQGKLKKSEIISYMELIINSTKRLEILCSNILNDRSAEGSFARYDKDISIYDLLADLKKFIAIGLDINHNQFIINVPANVVASTSETALNIILTNIISNANRFTKDGKITVNYEKIGNMHNLTVTDTGNGMPVDVAEKIKNRTLQVNHKDGTEFQSYGIGYSLIFKMLDVIKGDLHVSSEPLKGTSVTIKFPDLPAEK
ncbi:MAG: sensor histidine kinase [Bacteroidetes bacterium]|nr:sensor histidine kinase [Bacteroidota bacterium]